MKCIKRKDGSIDKVSNEQAAELVSKGEATYTNRKEWKIATGRWEEDKKS